MKNNNITIFFARCFGALILAMYFHAWKNPTPLDFYGTTFLVSGIIAGTWLLDIIKLGLEKIARNKNNYSIEMTTRAVVINGIEHSGLKKVSVMIPSFLINKFAKNVEENFGVKEEDINPQHCEKQNHSKISFILNEEDAVIFEKSALGMIRSMSGLNNINYN